MIISQDEYNVVKQPNRYLHIKVNLLNHNFQVVDELSGTVVGEPSFAINSSSDIRRTCSFSLIPTDSSFDIKYGNKIWMDKYVQIYTGIVSNRTKKIVYSNQGIYIVNNPSSSYSQVSNTLSIQGVDLMAKFTGLRDGKLEGIPYVVPEGSDVREAIIACLELEGFNKYIIEDFPIKTPYEIKVDVGGTVYDILSQLNNILPNYQMYFDVDGVFHFEEIPSGNNEQIFIGDNIWNNVLIDYTKNVDYSKVKNVIEVFGKTHEVSHFGDKAKIVGNTYHLNIPSIFYLRSYIKLGFISTQPLVNPKIKLNDYKEFPILNEDGTVPVLDEGNQYYVVKFMEYEGSTDEDMKGYYLFMGNVQPHAVSRELNPDSPFYVNGTLGEIREILQGGEFNNIYTDALAQERADWELYHRCKLKDTINIRCLPIYWADVNKVISITLPNEEKSLYIIKDINTTFGVTGTQSIQCMKYYPFYSNYSKNLKENKNE